MNGYQIWAAQILLNPTASIADPTKAVPTNQITPRVGFRFKQKFELEFEIRFDPIFRKSYLLICRSKNSKYYEIGILGTCRFQY
jgi:hypothetical protein